MNTANLQLEGLYLAIAAINNSLVAKGMLSRDEIDAALRLAEETAVGDAGRDDLSASNQDAVAFPARLLRLINRAASENAIPPFSEMARAVGESKAPGRPRANLRNPQRAVADEDPDYSPMDPMRSTPQDAAAAGSKRADDLPGAEGLSSARADEDTYD